MIREQMCQFQATGSNGTLYVVKAFRSYLAPGTTFEDQVPNNDPALWEYVASIGGVGQGWLLTRIKKGVYKILDTETTLESSDPNAA